MARVSNKPRYWFHSAFPTGWLPNCTTTGALAAVFAPCPDGHGDCADQDCTPIAWIVVYRETMRKGAPVTVVQTDTWEDAEALFTEASLGHLSAA